MAAPPDTSGRTRPAPISGVKGFSRSHATHQIPPGGLGRVSKLCSQCASLNLSQYKFTARDAVTALSSTVLTEFDSVGLDPTDLGFLDEIYRNRVTCSVCRLIYNATNSDTGPGIGHDGLDAEGRQVRCRIEWHLDSRSVDSKPMTRRLRVFSEEEKFAEIYVIPISPASGRIKVERAADHRLLSKWFTNCLNNHTSCREHQMAGSAPFTANIRLIDINLLCLREMSVHQLSASCNAYAALSYVWGRAQAMMLTNANYMVLHAPLGLESFREKLPKTVLNSFSVARQLGIGYIWVDALCIIQDDYNDKEIQIRMMDKIYQQAVLTICVAVGNDSNAGIPGVENTPRCLQQNLELYGNLQLTTVKPVTSLIRASMWDSRAWTFQERLLSTRCAIFTTDGMVWQCPTTTWREDIESTLKGAIWTLDSVGSPLRALGGNPLRSYSLGVNLYSGRKLSFLADN